MKIPEFAVPSGVKAAPFRSYATILEIEGVGGCTIDWVRRDFRLGFNSHVPDSFPPKYSGRGWAQRLVDDAAAELIGIQNRLEHSRVAPR